MNKGLPKRHHPCIQFSSLHQNVSMCLAEWMEWDEAISFFIVLGLGTSETISSHEENIPCRCGDDLVHSN